MKVRECMTREVEIGRPTMSIQDAAEMMREGDFGVLPIAENEKLVGMVTDRDIVIRAVAEGMNPKTHVSEVVSEKVLYCFDDEEIEAVAHNMGMNQIRRLPVLNRQKKLVGILSLGDLAQGDPKCAENALKDITRDYKKSSFFEASSL